jgi:hypothetical protein
MKVEIRDTGLMVRKYEVRIDGKRDRSVDVVLDEGRLYKIEMLIGDHWVELYNYDLRVLLEVLKRYPLKGYKVVDAGEAAPSSETSE